MAINGNNVKFLQGSYAALNNLTTSEVGAFYITNDTHEMFLGVDANKGPVALNRWVDIQADWDAVQSVSDYKQHPGKIYYAKNENILCTWNGEKWVQINPDTDTDSRRSPAARSAGRPHGAGTAGAVASRTGDQFRPCGGWHLLCGLLRVAAHRDPRKRRGAAAGSAGCAGSGSVSHVHRLRLF